MKVYLSGPINGCSDEECKSWREQAKSMFSDRITIIDPMDRDYRGLEDMVDDSEIVEADKHDLASCDAVLVGYTRESTGTAMEVLLAYQQEIPVILLPLERRAGISPWILYHISGIQRDMPSAVDAIEKLLK